MAVCQPARRLTFFSLLTNTVGQQQPTKRNVLKPRQIELRRRIWWLVLEVEVQISIHIGQPLNVSTRLLDGIERPSLEELDDSAKCLENSKLDFRQAALDLLGKIPDDLQEQVADKDYGSLVELINLRRLHEMQLRVPQLSLTTGDSVTHAVAIADHRIEFFAFKMLLGCVLANGSLRQDQSLREGKDAETNTKVSPTRAKQGKGHQKQNYEYQKDILGSATEILKTYEFVSQMEATEKGRNWTRCFAAYSAVVILAIAILRKEASLEPHHHTINNVQAIFSGLSTRNPSCLFAKLASSRITALSSEIKKLKSQSSPQASRGRRIKTEKSPTIARTSSGTLDAILSPVAKGSRKKRKSSMSDSAAAPESKRKKLELGISSDGQQLSSDAQPSEEPARTSARSQTMRQINSAASQPENTMYMGPYPHANFSSTTSTLRDNSYVLPDTVPYDVSEQNPYPYQWLRPPLSLPVSHPEVGFQYWPYHTEHLVPSTENAGFGYQHYPQIGTVGTSPVPKPMEVVEQIDNIDIPSGWHNQLPIPGYANDMNTHHLSDDQGYNSTRHMLGRHNSVPPILLQQQIDAQMIQQTGMMARQYMSSSSIPHSPQGQGSGSVVYPGMSFGPGSLRTQQSRPQISRHQTHDARTEDYTVHHTFQPFQEDLLHDQRL